MRSALSRIMSNSMIGLISDIHGNAVALRAVLSELDALGIQHIICLGDIAGYGPQVNECCQILISRSIPTLIGNHDFYLAFNEPCPRSTSANICLDYQHRIIKPEYKRWLGQNPKYLDLQPDIRMVHGGWNNPIDEYLYELRPSYFERLEGRHFFSGHTHVQGFWRLGSKTYCNPGSVGQPRDGNPHAAFATLDGDRVNLHRTPYDIDEIANASRQAGYNERLFENLYKGTRVGGKVSSVKMVADP